MTALRQRLRAVRALSSRRLPAVLQIYKFLLVALFICVIFIFAWPRERSYIVEAQTSSLSVTMSGLSDRAWQLEKAVICQRRSRLDLTAQPEKDLPDWAKGQCTQQRYVARYLDNGATLEWPALIHLKIYRPGAGWQAPLEILIDKNQPKVPENAKGKTAGSVLIREGSEPAKEVPFGSKILVSPEVWERSGSLLFSGQAVLGEVAFNNSRQMLIEGSYEIREVPTLLNALHLLPFISANLETIAVKSGRFRQGDEIRLREPCAAAGKHKTGDQKICLAPVNGFLVSAGPESPGFKTIIYGGTGRSILEVSRFGAVGADNAPSAPTRIVPDWTDRAINDPVLLGITAILVLISSLIQLYDILRSKRMSGATESPNRPRSKRRIKSLARQQVARFYPSGKRRR